MKTKSDLIIEARRSAKSRGHSLYKFTHVQDVPWLANSRCRWCLMDVQVNAKPAPNEIDIGGEAVALNCRSNF